MTTAEKQANKLMDAAPSMVINPDLRTAEAARDRASEVIVSPSIQSEVLKPSEMTAQKLDEIADYFRFTFNNEWPDYAVCPPCDQQLPGGMRLSAKTVYGSNEPISLDVMDNDPQLPDCPNCHQRMQIFHDPQKTRANMEKKLKPDGYASLFREPKEGKVVGFAFGYGAKMKDGFEYEWGNPYGYMAHPDPRYDRDFDHFLAKFREIFPEEHYEPDTPIFFWNCVALNPEVRGMGGNFMDIMRNLFNALPPEKREQFIIGEALKGSQAHSLFRTVGGIDVPGILEGGGIILRLKTGETTDRFNLSPEDFATLRKALRQAQKK